MKNIFCVLGMLVTFLLCVITTAMTVSGAREWYALAHRSEWLTVEASLISLDLERDMMGYEAQIEVSYTVSGNSHTENIRIKTPESSGEYKAKQQIAAMLRLKKVKWEDIAFKQHKAALNQNARVTISYHPAFPGHAFYDDGSGNSGPYTANFGLGMTMIFSAISLLLAWGFYSCVRALFRKPEKISDENLFADDVKH